MRTLPLATQSVEPGRRTHLVAIATQQPRPSHSPHRIDYMTWQAATNAATQGFLILPAGKFEQCASLNWTVMASST